MSSVNTNRLTGRIGPHLEWLVPAVLCVAVFAQLFFSSRQLSETADEATHLYSGYRYLVCGDLSVSPEHPPLAKLIAAASLLPLNPAVSCARFQGTDLAQSLQAIDWLHHQAWPATLLRARLAISIFAVGLCLLVWLSARRMFDLPTAAAATVLLAFEPNVLAFGALIMTDVPVTCMLLFAAFGFYCWTRNRTAPIFLLTALATGLTLLTKHSGLVVVPILCVLALADPLIEAKSRFDFRIMSRNLAAVFLICAIAFGMVWMFYGMQFGAHPGAPVQPIPVEPRSITSNVLGTMKYLHVLPEAYLEGFAGAFSISRQSGPVFLGGRIYPSEPWFSIPFYLSIRSTSALMALCLLAIAGFVGVLRQRRYEVLFLLIPAFVYIAVCFRSCGSSIRYLLPAIPFLLILVAAGCVKMARRNRWAAFATVLLILLHVALSARAFPNYLSYANEFWGGPAQAYKYLPMLDSGQAYIEAKSYLAHHPVSDCWLITGWQWDPALYGIPCHTFSPYLPNEIPAQVNGTIIVSSSLINDVRLMESSLAAPFKRQAAKDEIAGSALLVYEGEFDTRFGVAAHELVLMMAAASIGQSSIALEHGNRAAAFSPDNGYTRGYLCLLLSKFGQPDAARKECLTAQSLLLSDPMREETSRKNFLIAVRDNLGPLEQSESAH